MLEIENIILKNVSYLHARDPSILAWNRHGLDEVRVNLAEKLLNDETTENTENINQETEGNNFQVFLRIKNGIPFEKLYEIHEQNLICKVPDGSFALRHIKEGESMTKTYSFTKIFGPKTTQTEVFNDVVKVKTLGFINGKNCTLLTYGASGSGKTFTIVGTAEEPGLIPRALEYIFRTIPKLQETPKVIPLPNGEISYLNEQTYHMEKMQKSTILNATLIDRSTHIKTYKQMQQRLSSEVVAEIEDVTNVSISIWVSFAEIYNESIFDLLKAPPPRGKQRPRLQLGNSNEGCFIKDLTSIHVTSGIEAYQILQFGLHNLKYAATSVNSHSSRSHCIFTIKLVQVSDVEDGAYISTFNFCDLAGSERVKKTLNVGDRLKESNNINTSLLVLGRCINSIRSAQQNKDNRLIPFRESKLTQLFQKALMGLEDIMMIVNINPSRDMFDESQHVLNFSAVAKEIVVEEQVKVIKPKKKNRFSQYMEKKTGSVQPIAQIEDEKDIEIDRLKMIISDMYNEIEHKRREFEVEQKVERDNIISCYRNFIENLTQEKNATIEKLKKELKEMRSLNIYYNECLKDQEEVICLDSSSEEDASPKKNSIKDLIKELEKTVSEQNDEIVMLQQRLCETEFENERLKKETQQVPILKEEIKVLSENSNLKIMLYEAEEAYSDLQSELQAETDKNKKLMSENRQLTEKVEYLEEQLLSYNSM